MGLPQFMGSKILFDVITESFTIALKQLQVQITAVGAVGEIYAVQGIYDAHLKNPEITPAYIFMLYFWNAIKDLMNCENVS
ncbi:hypothetical protein BWQ96_07790 [Gracilariopsis chorda]|uniref:Uncharacterized protein n=1 Tax=Gracilariopsis chorda TaxID=448386 RepID=A0A2V3IK88_9FLOR|nr:hypothetical protein BWQ96_07790 [Gracilariopsis chorda]|eukprot:PXF42481.1 hypothetical protein BWQ96_07790 [Gracilariopsis chorda]